MTRLTHLFSTPHTVYYHLPPLALTLPRLVQQASNIVVLFIGPVATQAMDKERTLSLGTCLFEHDSSAETFTGLTSSGGFPRQGTLSFLFGPPGPLSLCRPDPRILDCLRRPSHVCFRSDVEVVPWKREIDGTRAIDDLVGFLRKYADQQYTIRPVEDNKGVVMGEGCSHKRYRARVDHENEDLDDKQARLWCFSKRMQIVPLRRLDIRQHGGEKTPPLALAYWKRKLTGVHIAFLGGKFTSTLRVNDSVYSVESVSADSWATLAAEVRHSFTN